MAEKNSVKMEAVDRSTPKEEILRNLLLGDGEGSLPANAKLVIDHAWFEACEYGICPVLYFKDRTRGFVASTILKTWNSYTSTSKDSGKRFVDWFKEKSKNPSEFFDWWVSITGGTLVTGNKEKTDRENPHNGRLGIKCTIDWE